MENDYLYNSWLKLLIPQKNGLMLKRHNESNLWYFKTDDECFGVLINNCFSGLAKNYQNLKGEWKNSILNTEDNSILNNCLIVKCNEKIDVKTFCTGLTPLFEFENNHTYSSYDLEEILNRIEDIVLKESSEFNEVIGVWGELYLLNTLVTNIKDDKQKFEIINAWEGDETRSKIDFNFASKNIKIEVKTTSQENRIHYFSGLSQLNYSDNWHGYLASICIQSDLSGKSCADLIKIIKSNITSECEILLYSKLKLRSRVSFNNKFKFIINPAKKMELYNFQDVPKPLTQPGVGKIEWESNLENILALSFGEKLSILDL